MYTESLLNTNTTKIILDYRFNAGNLSNPFYSPILISGIDIDIYDSGVEADLQMSNVSNYYVSEDEIFDLTVPVYCGSTCGNTNVTLYYII